MPLWRDLSSPWIAACEEAAMAYLHEGSAPIGAAVVDGAGAIVSRGRNGLASSRLAHAETSALNRLPGDADGRTLELYSTLEPCPMCIGAVRIWKLRAVRFAAKDPSAGSAEFLSANAFMRSLPCEAHGPEDRLLEGIIVALVCEHRIRTNHLRWRDEWVAYHPTAAAFGASLAQRGAHSAWVRSKLTAEELFDELAGELQRKPGSR